MTTTAPGRPAPTKSPFRYLDDPECGAALYVIDADRLPKVTATPGTGKGELLFRTPGGSLAATNISTSAGLFAAAAEALALAHAVAAAEDAQRDAQCQAALSAAEVQA